MWNDRDVLRTTPAPRRTATGAGFLFTEGLIEGAEEVATVACREVPAEEQHSERIDLEG
jgi:formate dehydrogenase assembly factor FdhD